jgi:hypothetical protein
MKQLILFLVILVMGVACSTPKNTVQITEKEETEAPVDSLEYSLETFDSRFETWYMMQNSPARYRSLEYYENWNRQYVAAWNYNATTSRRRGFFEPIVGYDPTVDYGFELNHKLFYYFQYVEQVLKIQIMPGGPRNIVF